MEKIECLDKIFMALIPRNEKKMLQYRQQYMMLSRLQNDFVAYFGTGDVENDRWDCRFQNEKMIWSKSIKELFEEMERIYKVIPWNMKPEWCTRFRMRKYKKLIKLIEK